MKLYPAYARTIAAHLARGNQPVAIAVMLSARWWWFDHVAKVCIRPDEWKLGRWEFGYLQNQHVIAIWGDEAEAAQFGELLIDLMLAGPRLIWAREVGGDWLLRESNAWRLRLYADELTKRAHADLAALAESAYTRAQLRDLELIEKNVQRALEREAESVPFVTSRNAAEQMVEQLFSSPYAPVDEHAA